MNGDRSQSRGAVTTHRVDIQSIEHALAELRWRLKPDGEEGEAAEHTAAEARASVLNLVAVVRSEDERRWIADVLERLSVHHPSRTLVLLAEQERAPLTLEGTVSAKSSLTGGHRIVTEQVLLHACGPVAEHLASIVGPLLIADLPVMLWWPGRPPFGTELFDELADICDRLIVDTNGLDSRDFPLLLDVARRRLACCAIGDFNWARLLPWRELAAQFFDPPLMCAQLFSMKGLTVWSGAEGSDAQARLLAGWVQSRLAAAGVEVPAEVHADQAEAPGVARLMLYTAEEGESMARFTIARQPGGCLTTAIRVGEEESLGQTVAIAPRDPAELLAMELTIIGHDGVYEDALAAASRV